MQMSRNLSPWKTQYIANRKRGVGEYGDVLLLSPISPMAHLAMSFHAPRVNGEDLTALIGETVRLTGKAFKPSFDGNDVQFLLEAADHKLIKVTKAGVSSLILTG
jgi:hypothetical protein